MREGRDGAVLGGDVDLELHTKSSSLNVDAPSRRVDYVDDHLVASLNLETRAEA
jgi:hypothetical protein